MDHPLDSGFLLNLADCRCDNVNNNSAEFGRCIELYHYVSLPGCADNHRIVGRFANRELP
jgi:hypothetical protein